MHPSDGYAERELVTRCIGAGGAAWDPGGAEWRAAESTGLQLHVSQKNGHHALKLKLTGYNHVFPGGLVMREYGRYPLTSPGPHSMVFRGPRPRSMEIAMWPDNTMIIFS